MHILLQSYPVQLDLRFAFYFSGGYRIEKVILVEFFPPLFCREVVISSLNQPVDGWMDFFLMKWFKIIIITCLCCAIKYKMVIVYHQFQEIMFLLFLVLSVHISEHFEAHNCWRMQLINSILAVLTATVALNICISCASRVPQKQTTLWKYTLWHGLERWLKMLFCVNHNAAIFI